MDSSAFGFSVYVRHLNGGVKSETSEWGGGGSSETDFLTSSERKFSTNEEGAEKKGGLNRNSEGGFLRSSGL